MDTKLLSLNSLLEYMNISREEILFIGDCENDYTMFMKLKILLVWVMEVKGKKTYDIYNTNNNNNSGVTESIYHFVR